MKPDLSIVIVNWKVAAMVERLLDSISAQTSGITLEMFIVDNASADDLAARVGRWRTRHPEQHLELILNRKNLGFAAACNQAIRRSQGRYVVLLNPDTQVLDGALQKMIAYLDAHPKVGIAGPKLLNEDGTTQASVRREPRLLDQFAILFKLPHLHIFPKALKRYLYEDFDYDTEADVPQVMGAAFFIRRACLDIIGMLDERFFIWFEEVDFCKRAREAGWMVQYTPIATIAHRGGASFAQEMTLKKQWMFFSSLSNYFWKHRDIGLTTFLLCGLAELLSFVAWRSPEISLPLFIVLSLGAFIVSLRDVRAGLLLLVAEMTIGAHGHLFGYGAVSIRMTLFGAVVIGWLAELFRTRGWSRLRSLPMLPPLAGLCVAVSWGMVRGLLSSGQAFNAVFADANAYAFVLLIPIALDVFRSREDRTVLAKVFVGAVLWLSVKTLLFFALFSHDFGPFLTDLRLWQRQLGLMEVTPATPGGWHRIFSASDLMLIPAIVWGLWSAHNARKDRSMLLVFPVAALLIAFSRSFWFGLLLGGLAALMFSTRNGRLRVVSKAFFASLAAAALIAIIMLIPWNVGGPSSGLDVRSRLDVSDAAVTSRSNMLVPLRAAIMAHPVVGSGFGATITYQSSDPRMFMLYPKGVVTTSAIEWQYLELWLKMGVLGLLAITWLFFALAGDIRRAIKVQKDDGPWGAVALASFVAFVALNVFTPYINHPLGWMYLALLLVSIRPYPDSR